jgi:hypothetical protein
VQIAGWAGFDTIRCTYSVQGKREPASKTGLVIMLNPSARTLSAWILNACSLVRSSENQERCARRLFARVLDQSGGQFAIAGIVYEDLIPTDGIFEAYGFSNGVTVLLDGVKHRRTTPFSPDELKAALAARPTGTASASAPARIVGLTRQEYVASNRGADVSGLKWPGIVRDAHQAAMRSDRNVLLEAWLRAHGP